MAFYIGTALCFLPLIIGILLFSLIFKLRFTHQLIAVFAGLVAVFPISFIQYFLPDFSGLFHSPILFSLIKSLIVYGLIEECLKSALLIPLPHKNYTLLQSLILAFVTGLALGCFESVVYFFDYFQMAHGRGAQLLYGQIFLRIFTSDLIHLFCTGLGGIFIFTCRSKKAHISILILAVLLHGFYDFFAGFTSSLRLFSIAVILLAMIECRIKYKSILEQE